MKNLVQYIQEKLQINKDSKIKDTNRDEWIDLGLPSGILWCSHNVDAKSEEDFGEYFDFFEAFKIPFKRDKKTFVPGQKEFNELLDNCDYEITYINNIKGMKFISKSNNNYIFLPAAGSKQKTGKQRDKNRGYYWSKTQSTLKYSYILFFSSKYPNVKTDCNEELKLSVRLCKK